MHRVDQPQGVEALKLAGRPLSDEEAGPVTWDGWMRKQ
jgi:hypothetical protein